MRLVRFLLVLAAVCGLSVPAAAQLVANTAQGSPFEFPQGGTLRASRHITSVSASSVTIDSVATGNSGVIRSILMADTAGDTTAITDYYMTIRYDGSAVATDSFPLLALFGYDGAQRGVADTTHTFETPFWERRMPTGSTLGSSGLALALRYPIPYTNGIVVKIGSLANAHNIWVTTMRQTFLPACWNRTYRFHVSRTDSTLIAAATVPTSGTRKVWFSAAGQGHGSNTAVKDQHVGWAFIGTAGGPPWNKEIVLTGRTADTLFTVSGGDLDAIISQAQKTSPLFTRPEVFFRRPAGKVGYIASMCAALSTGTGDTNRIEACPRFYTDNPNAGSDGQTPEIIGTGFEDWFNGVGYGFAASGTNNGLPGLRCGVTGYDANNAGGSGAQMTGYRVFDRDPIAYTGGCSATFTNWTTATCRMRATVVYYEKQ